MASNGMSIGEQSGYFESQDKIAEKLRRRAAAVKTLQGLDVVADEARDCKVFHRVSPTIKRANARLRGRDYDVLYKHRDGLSVTVRDNRAVGLPKATRDLCAEGFVYAGRAE